MIDPENFEEIELVSPDGLVKVTLEWHGEGCSGDFDPGDAGEDDESGMSSDESDDTPLLRYDLYRRYSSDLDQDKIINLCDTDSYEDGDWMAVTDGSYCTNLSAWDDRAGLEKAVQFIMDQVYPGLKDMTRQKRLYESLSWVSLVENEVVCEMT